MKITKQLQPILQLRTNIGSVSQKCSGMRLYSAWADPEGGGGGDKGVRTSLKNHKNIGFLSNTGPDPLENHYATNPL